MCVCVCVCVCGVCVCTVRDSPDEDDLLVERIEKLTPPDISKESESCRGPSLTVYTIDITGPSLPQGNT